MPTIHRAEQVLYGWLQAHKPKITARYDTHQLRVKRKQLLQSQPELISDLSAARRVHLKQLADETGDNHKWVDTAFEVFYEARQKVTLYDDVIPVLSALKKDYKLVALTNGNAHISKTGLSEYFDFQVSAADVQAAKPDPLMFLQAMQKAGVSHSQTLHVGDHPVHDIKGARNAGIEAVWLRRFEQVWDQDEVEPELQFTNLQQFQSWLDQR